MPSDIMSSDKKNKAKWWDGAEGGWIATPAGRLYLKHVEAKS